MDWRNPPSHPDGVKGEVSRSARRTRRKTEPQPSPSRSGTPPPSSTKINLFHHKSDASPTPSVGSADESPTPSFLNPFSLPPSSDTKHLPRRKAHWESEERDRRKEKEQDKKEPCPLYLPPPSLSPIIPFPRNLLSMRDGEKSGGTR
ncbi:hypothetical protein IE53DRAFT_175773 [Violaceomyces palustris]|uniref:Uncharacterized protein n=1 Tax=Violaceomyces palustris TaxID=1673888 RepID=A0ACD0NSK5_9BASI|nr:hypothetical protein IE53DRAFT_175773 [Violaceomyces palustris]